ncbi:MAG: hypothetical protein JWL59_399 [Chthoniobacteraceae bacterium]|nr:hypothetical protein [Chthoniobacteraceae bacterium]
MKIFMIFLIAAMAAVGGWLVGRHSAPAGGQAAHGHAILFYQSPMHPWIKSDKPGNCTICGMKLVPVIEGEQPLDNGGQQTGVRLSTQSIGLLNVETAKVTRQPLRRTLRVAGTINEDESRHRRLSAYVEGRIEKLMVNYVGAEVTAGEPLAYFYSPALLAARDEFLLLTHQGGTQARLLEAARARLLRMGLTAAQIDELPRRKNQDNYIEILAPISGTVIERKIYEGQYVKEGELLFEIADFSRMWFMFDAYERDLGWVKAGQTVDVTTPSVPGKMFTAPITFIDPNLMPQTRTARVRVAIENPLVGEPPHRELLHRAYGEAIAHAEINGALVVPRSAVLSPGGEPVVYVAKGGGYYEPRRVRLGRAGDQYWELLDGLVEGDEIVTTGNLLIDAQAHLDKGAAEPAMAAPAKELTADQRTAAREFLVAMDALGAALAADDLARFNEEAAKFHKPFEGIKSAFGAYVQRISAEGQLTKAHDLGAARKAFINLSMAASQFASVLKTQDPGFAGIKVFECPMAKAAVPSAGSDKGQWVQLGEPLRNPFFGHEMIECGAEVR